MGSGDQVEEGSMEKQVFDEPIWAIVELMGRHVVAGEVSEVTVAGAGMLRVDVPAVDGSPGCTKFLGGSAIYAITPVGEAEAREAIRRLKVRPVHIWVVPDRPALPSSSPSPSRATDLDVEDCGV